MTKRQQSLGVSEYGYNRGIKQGEFLADIESFLAKASTIKKGQYKGIELVEKWFGIKSYGKLEEVQPFLFGLTVLYPDNFTYTDTHGLDLFTVK